MADNDKPNNTDASARSAGKIQGVGYITNPYGMMVVDVGPVYEIAALVAATDVMATEIRDLEPTISKLSGSQIGALLVYGSGLNERLNSPHIADGTVLGLLKVEQKKRENWFRLLLVVVAAVLGMIGMFVVGFLVG